MKRIIRQVFGTTRPSEIYMDLLTFDRMVTKPIVHIVYWVGLALFFIGACVVFGMAAGIALHEAAPWSFLLALPTLIGGWLAVLIGTLLWRGFCEFYLAVMNIAADLRYLRQYQEKLEAPAVAEPAPTAHVATFAPQPQPQPQPQSAVASFDAAIPDAPPPSAPDAQRTDVQATDRDGNILEDPFFRPRFGKQEQ